jgi:XamI-like restriction endonuclease
MSKLAFPYWSERQLDRLRRESRKLFINRYSSEIQAAYQETLVHCRGRVRDLLAETSNLRTLKKDGSTFDTNRHLLDPARYCTAPVISADTLKIVGESAGTEATILAFLDDERFPWIAANRAPKRSERERAVTITAKLWADQKAKTASRTSYSKAQERRTQEALKKAGLVHVPRREIRKRLKALGDNPTAGLTVSNWSDALHRGEYTDELKLAGTKCDVPARLADGRLLPIECKVSNSELNSIKRLMRETGGKHSKWRSTLGNDLATAAVLGGTFKMIHLNQAQQEGMLLFFEHRLGSLAAFIKAGGHPSW